MDIVGREPISAFVITFNEEDKLARCLETIDFCDEIVVIDCFSTDRTVEIAKEYGARVVFRAWTNFRDQKSFGLDQTTHDWILNVDADEHISPELRESILKVLADEWTKSHSPKRFDRNSYVGYELNRVVFFLGRWWRRGGWYPEWRLRFFRKSFARWCGSEVHERVMVTGKVGRLQGEMPHYSFRDMDHQFQKLQSLSSSAAEQDFARGKKAGWLQVLGNPLARVFKFYVLRRGYREGLGGVVMAITEGSYTFMKYAKLWALHEEARNASKDIAPAVLKLSPEEDTQRQAALRQQANG